jgi:hypothetical protein
MNTMEVPVGTQIPVRGLGLLYTDWQIPHITRLSRDEVQGAVMDPEWKVLRISMRGLSTFMKMEMLQAYWRRQKISTCEREVRLARVRVIHYLVVLKHDGHIDHQGRIVR